MNLREKTEQWWRQSGCARLNAELADIRGLGIGDIPLSNLEMDLPETIDSDRLAELITADGIPAIRYRYSKMQDDEDIIIRIL